MSRIQAVVEKCLYKILLALLYIVIFHTRIMFFENEREEERKQDTCLSTKCC
jgi:hypothetical protein